MKRKFTAFLLMFLLIFTLVGCGGSGQASSDDSSADETAQPAESYTWRLPHEEVTGSCQDFYATTFKSIVEKDPRITVEVYPVGQLGDSTNQVELLQMGGVEFAINNPGATATIIPEANIFSLHFLMPSDMAKVREVVNNGNGIKLLNDLYAEQNMTVLDWFPEGYNMWTANKPIRTPEDMKGFKIRTMAAPIIAKSYEAYGANPVPIPYMELYSALQLKMVDGQVNPLFAIDEMKFCEVQTHLMIANQDSFLGTFAANKDYWESLPEDVQKIVKDAVEETNELMFAEQDRLNKLALENIKAGSDVEVIELTDAERDVLRQMTGPAREAFAEMTGETGQELMDLLLADAAALE